MKVLDIAWKDIVRSFRSIFFLLFGFVIPLLMAGLFYIAFGNLSSQEGHFNLPATKVLLVNLDQPAAQVPDFSAGREVAALLQSTPLQALFTVTETTSAADARAAVDHQAAGVAIILPEKMTAALVSPTVSATVELYSDPTLTLGPSILKAIVRTVVDSYAGARISIDVATAQLQDHNVPIGPTTQLTITQGYTAWARSMMPNEQGIRSALVSVHSPGAAQEEESGAGAIVAKIMAGMLVFYAFYTGAASALGLLQEEEDGTLARVFTTPTPHSAVIGGRCIGTVANLVVQVTVLFIVSALAFGIRWGDPLGLALMALGIIVMATGFGVFVTSLLKNVRQSGIIYGGVLTVLGMLGMLSIFTGIDPRQAATLNLVGLFVPHGWGVRGLLLLQYGQSAVDVLPSVAVSLALGAIFFAIGLWRFRKRFA